MMKISRIKVLAAVAICLTAASCSEESNDIEQELRDNFKALVMGGREVDSLQDWSTASGLDVKIAVDYGNTSVYKVYILPSPALYDSEAAYLGMVQVNSGESRRLPSLVQQIMPCSMLPATTARVMQSASLSQRKLRVLKSFLVEGYPKVPFLQTQAALVTAGVFPNWKSPMSPTIPQVRLLRLLL